MWISRLFGNEAGDRFGVGRGAPGFFRPGPGGTERRKVRLKKGRQDQLQRIGFRKRRGREKTAPEPVGSGAGFRPWGRSWTGTGGAEDRRDVAEGQGWGGKRPGVGFWRRRRGEGAGFDELKKPKRF
jgi:hypothetical protein